MSHTADHPRSFAELAGVTSMRRPQYAAGECSHHSRKLEGVEDHHYPKRENKGVRMHCASKPGDLKASQSVWTKLGQQCGSVTVHLGWNRP